LSSGQEQSAQLPAVAQNITGRFASHYRIIDMPAIIYGLTLYPAFLGDLVLTPFQLLQSLQDSIEARQPSSLFARRRLNMGGEVWHRHPRAPS